MIRTVAETGSTNADLLALVRSGNAEEGVWLRAERQTAGRGRQGREWVSPPGNLYASTVVRLRPEDPPAATLGFVAAVAVAEVVCCLLGGLQTASGLRGGGLMVKWPNDLLIDGAKVSGILLERADDAVVVGVGANLSYYPDLPERRATSLDANGVTIAASAFIEHVAESFAGWLLRWRDHGFAGIRTRWLEVAHPPGTPLRAALPDGSVVQGAFADLDGAGALILHLASGERRAIHAGDVFLV